MEYIANLHSVSENVRKLKYVEEKLWFLEQCFLSSSILSRGIREIGFQPRRYFGFSIPSMATMEVLQQYIDSDTEVLEIGCGLGLYAFVFGSPFFCKQWYAFCYCLSRCLYDFPKQPMSGTRPNIQILTRNGFLLETSIPTFKWS